MKKLAMIITAALAVFSCAKISSTDIYSPDESLHKTGEVSLCLSLDKMETKVNMDQTGHFLFDKNDSIAVACTDGSFVKLYLDGTGDTKRAIFKGVIPNGKTLDGAVVYPADAAKRCFKGVVTLDFAENRVFGTPGYQSIMVGALGDDWFVNMHQVASYLQVSVKNVSTAAGMVGFRSNDKLIAGYYDLDLSSLGKKAPKLVDGRGEVCFEMTSVPSTAVFSFPVPAGTIPELYFISYDSEGTEVTKEVITTNLSLNSGELRCLEFKSSAKVNGKQLNISGMPPINLKQSSEGIWEATSDVPATGTFSLVVDGTVYGFKPFSGAGGLGLCQNAKSALPFYNFLPEHTKFYNVGRATGEIARVEDGADEFWLNMEAPAKMHFVYNTTRADGDSYYFELIKEDDPNTILDEQFDLFTCGGDMNFYLYGSSTPATDSYDGISAATKNGAKWNASADANTMWDYPTAVGSTLACKEYIRNRGVEGWTFVRAGERPSAIQLNQGNNFDSYLITPRLSEKVGTGDAVITLEISRYSSTSKSDIYVELLGGGSFTSGHVFRSAYKTKSGSIKAAEENTYENLSGSKFAIGTDYCIPPNPNEITDKPVSTYTFNVTGLCADSQIKIHAPFVSENAPRCFILGIKVEKK